VYNAKDCLATLWAKHALHEELLELPHGLVHSKRQHQLFEVARKMTRAGIMWDDNAAQAHDVRLTEKMKKCEAFMQACVDRAGMSLTINMNSTAHLRKYFYSSKGVEPIFFTGKGAPSIGENALAAMKAHEDPDVRNAAHAVLEYRESAKLKGSYLVNARDLVRKGRVHPDWRPYGAKTGRWSGKDPAIQTIPDKMRDLYRAPPGKWLIYPDFSQLELRVIAALAQDEPLLQAFASGIRIHTKNAQDVFQSAFVQGDKAQERNAKVVVFTINYGGSASTIWQRLVTQGINVTLEFCENLLANWYKAHPALKTYLEATFKRASKELYLELPLSKRRLTWWRKPRRQETANWPIQSTGADIVDKALIEISNNVDWDNTKVVGQIHDAFLIETNDVLNTCELLNRAMVFTWPLDVNGRHYELKFSIGFNISNQGGHWGCTTEYKSIEAVRDAAAKGVFT
jgi:DNA polymerase-1